ncbi:MAG TPA: STAS/SEC14 domain-containing protein [Mycobacterium sp.]|nr:STAS/SEC14 domain-containing protein [Mycobacterium sp.]
MLTELVDVPAGVHAIEATDVVTSDDYAQVFAPLVDRLAREGQRLRLLYQFGPGFARLTPGALWADSLLGVRYLPLLDGCALVSDIDWIREPGRGIAAWVPCPMRVYADEQRDEAAAWLAALPQCQRPSTTQFLRAYVGGTGGAVVSLGKVFLLDRVALPTRYGRGR